MAKDLLWCHEQNARRAAERRQAGVKTRAPKTEGCLGRKAARQAWVQRRSQQRLQARMMLALAKKRAARRPFIQGRRRLYGKGPPPRHFTNATLHEFSHCSSKASERSLDDTHVSPTASLAAKETVTPLLQQGSPSWSLCAECCSPASFDASPGCPLGDEEDEPIDAAMLRLMDGMFKKECIPPMPEKVSFRMLVRHAGVRLGVCV